MKPNHAEKRQISAIFVALLLFNMVLVMLQLWLFASVLEAVIHGDSDMAVPAAIASVGLLLVNIWMLRGIKRFG
jgi:hypothetical protein